MKEELFKDIIEGDNVTKLKNEVCDALKKMDNEEMVLRPMNCPHHMLIYKSKTRSYRDLPIRIGELANDFRYENSGAVCGLERVRQMCQNDAHLFVRPDQIKEEVGRVLNLIFEVYLKDFGFPRESFSFRLSLRDKNNKEKYIDNDAMWETAESQLRDILKELNIDFYEAEGEAAFYGPKLDILIKPAVGNEVALSTIQLDFLLPRRFELYYINEKGEKMTPVVIHRAILGSLDRFIAFLLEETKGSLPLWLAPNQVNIIPVNNEYHLEYANSLMNKLKELEMQGIDALVIDVRDNNGGYLTTVTDIASSLLPKGKNIYQIQKDNKKVATKDKTSTKREYPIAIIVNGNSASASEILAGAIKESHNGYVVGTKTYGKGTVQQVKTLSDGSMIKYTIENWLTPDGNWINEKGIEPTDEVELSKEYYENPTNENDNQLQEAINLIIE